MFSFIGNFYRCRVMFCSLKCQLELCTVCRRTHIHTASQLVSPSRVVLVHRKSLNWTCGPLSQFVHHLLSLFWTIECQPSCPISISMFHVYIFTRFSLFLEIRLSTFKTHLISCYICFSLVPNELCIYTSHRWINTNFQNCGRSAICVWNKIVLR